MDILVVIKLTIILLISGFFCEWFFRRMSQVDPPAVFVMSWSLLGQHLLKGSSFFIMAFMPEIVRTKKIMMGAPTCANRFNRSCSHGILREGFFITQISFPSTIQALNTILSET